MSRNWFLLLTIMVFLAAGCTMAPEYSRPEAPVPAQWPAGAAYSGLASPASVPAAAELAWWEFLPDKSLQAIIETALHNNRDLRVAALNAEMVRAYYGIQRATLLPAVNAVGSASKGRVPADLSATGSAYTAEQYSVNLGITSWEID